MTSEIGDLKIEIGALKIEVGDFYLVIYYVNCIVAPPGAFF